MRSKAQSDHLLHDLSSVSILRLFPRALKHWFDFYFNFFSQRMYQLYVHIAFIKRGANFFQEGIENLGGGFDA
jgi:hypothetical protein